jgi:threonine/homoserine/homoserine lactone efflux protein
VTGHLVTEVLVIALLMAGLGTVLSGKRVQMGIALVGGVVLIIMGAAMFRGMRKLNLDADDSGNDSAGRLGPLQSMLGGSFVSLSSPYFLLWWAGIGLPLITDALRVGPAGVLAFFVGHAGSDFVWYGMVSRGVHSGRRWFAGTGYKVLVGFCAAALILFGILFLKEGVMAFSGAGALAG